MLTEQQQEWIDEIMDNFDFERVHKTMVALDWGWATDEMIIEVPDIKRIRSEARSMMKRCLETCTAENTGIGSGGFVVMFHGDGLTLRFVVEDYGAWSDQ